MTVPDASHGLSQPPSTPSRPPSRARWVLLTLGLVLLPPVGCTAYVYWRFTPLMEIDQSAQKMSFLGGFIQIDALQGRVTLGKRTYEAPQAHTTLQGTTPIRAPQATRLEVLLRVGQIDVAWVDKPQLNWRCEAVGPDLDSEEAELPKILEGGKLLRMNLKTLVTRSCRFEIPPGTTLDLKSYAAQVALDRPRSPVSVQVQSGRIQVRPDPAASYAWEVEVLERTKEGPKPDTPSWPQGKGQPVWKLDLQVGRGSIGLF